MGTWRDRSLGPPWPWDHPGAASVWVRRRPSAANEQGYSLKVGLMYAHCHTEAYNVKAGKPYSYTSVFMWVGFSATTAF